MTGPATPKRRRVDRPAARPAAAFRNASTISIEAAVLGGGKRLDVQRSRPRGRARKQAQQCLGASDVAGEQHAADCIRTVLRRHVRAGGMMLEARRASARRSPEATVTEQHFTSREILARHPGLTDDHLRYLRKWGLIQPAGRKGHSTSYTFADLGVIRQVSAALTGDRSFHASCAACWPSATASSRSISRWTRRRRRSSA